MFSLLHNIWQFDDVKVYNCCYDSVHLIFIFCFIFHYSLKLCLRYFADQYGYVQGAANMKKEIWKRGPIGCGVDATDEFDKYSGGIFKQKIKQPMINHEISVVGWGKDDITGEEYWIGRNSWGTYWVIINGADGNINTF